MRKIISLFMTAIVTLSLCSCDVIENIKRYLPKNEEHSNTEVINSEKSNDVANAINICMYDFDTFNPLLTASQSVKDAMKFVYEPLFSLDESLNPVTVLASEYWLSDDGRCIDIKLKNGVSWHDGAAFNAYDVSYTINCILKGQTNYMLNDVASCSIIDNMNVRINFNHSLPNGAALLTFPIIKNRTSMTPNSSYMPIGTGPFSYSGKVSVDRYMLLASDYYHNQKAKIGGVYIDVVPDRDRYFTMFNSGNADVCNASLIEDYQYTPKGNIQINDFISNELIYLGINNSSPFLAGKNARQAIFWMIDKEEIAQKVMYSTIQAVDVSHNPSSVYYTGSNNIRTDSIKAQELLEADGFVAQTKGYTKVMGNVNQQLRVTLLVNKDNAGDVMIAQKIHDNLNMNGIKIVSEELPYDVYTQRIQAKNYDIYLGRHNMSANMDVTDLLGASNKFGYNNVTIEMLISQLGTTRDETDKKALYQQLHDVLNDDMPIVPIAFKKDKIYTSARINNVSPMGADAFYVNLQNWSIK